MSSKIRTSTTTKAIPIPAVKRLLPDAVRDSKRRKHTSIKVEDAVLPPTTNKRNENVHVIATAPVIVTNASVLAPYLPMLHA